MGAQPAQNYRWYLTSLTDIRWCPPVSVLDVRSTCAQSVTPSKAESDPKAPLFPVIAAVLLPPAVRSSPGVHVGVVEFTLPKLPAVYCQSDCQMNDK
mmetsp:Transcript_38380/g.76905  ORF Transcript_38380/g.76905 Transcript_38380/m.76905 type:complete len:97 (-) Transcript_38380:90-380(-)